MVALRDMGGSYPGREPSGDTALSLFVARARRIYDSEARLRQKDQLVDQVLYNQHQISIPPAMASRAFPYRSGILSEKLTRATYLLSPDDGPVITAAPIDETEKSSAMRSAVQEFLQGALWCAEKNAERRVLTSAIMDLILRSRGWVRVLPDPSIWRAMPESDLAERVDAAALESKDEAARIAREGRARQESYKRKRFPIRIEHVPAQHVTPLYDRDGLREVWEFQDLAAEDVLESYRTASGAPMAKRLAESVVAGELTPLHRVTVVTRATRERITCAIISLTFDGQNDVRPDAVQMAGSEEFLYDEEHQMGVVPYAHFPGLEMPSSDPVLRYRGFLDAAVDKVQSYDQLMTQLGSTVRFAAWPTLIGEQAADGLGSGDKITAITLKEGEVTVLPPGMKLTVPGWTNAADWHLWEQHARSVRSDIDEQTLQRAATGGTGGADSGYFFAELKNAAESALAPWHTGAKIGVKRLCDLILRAGAVLLEQGLGSIPVRYTSREGMRYVSLTDEMTAIDWDIDVQIQMRPPGGEAALVQTLNQMIQMGILDKEEAMRRLGNRNPEATLRAIRREQIIDSPTLRQALEAPIVQRVQQEALAAVAPTLPQDGAIPQALGGVLQSPLAQARLPEEAQMTPNTGGFPGLPGPLGNHLPTAAPPLSTQQQASLAGIDQSDGAGLKGGRREGMAQTTPGGVNRQAPNMHPPLG